MSEAAEARSVVDDGPPPIATLSTPLHHVLDHSAAQALSATLGLATVADLLHHFPRRYRERGELSSLDDVVEGTLATVCVVVDTVSERSMPRRGGRKMLVVGCHDEHGTHLEMSFFSVWPHRGALTKGGTVMASGKFTRYVRGNGRPVWQLRSPDYAMVDGDATTPTPFAGAILPVYPQKGAVSTLAIEAAIRAVLAVLAPVPGPLPDEMLTRQGRISYDQALRRVHVPGSRDDVDQAVATLRYIEAVVSQTALALRRVGAAAQPTKPRTGASGGIADLFDANLPFPLTTDQLAAGHDIAQDLATPHPMHRLLQGEVGTGKTIVALRAMLRVADSGGQAAMLAPTEVLAQQHYLDLLAKLGGLTDPSGSNPHIDVVLLTGSMSGEARRDAISRVASSADVIVGTHALLSADVAFRDLGLVVVDEQHRFGIAQRDALRRAGGYPPHLLMMSATPIPRSVAMTVFGDLDVSSVTQIPSGRQEVTTHVVPSDRPGWVDRVWVRVREEVDQGRQAFIVCPRISSDDEPGDEVGPADVQLDSSYRLDDDLPRPQLTAVEDLAGQLQAGLLPGVSIQALHGRMHPDDKERIMRSFAAGQVAVLVCTTVIEVGVNVPNCSVIVIMDSDRFGISQLHQLRGRVGRGSLPGTCLLHTTTPEGHPSRARLEAVASTRDGAALARIDLALRGEGDVLGAAQSGRRSAFHFLKVAEHEQVITVARDEAERIVRGDPALRVHPALAAAVRDLVDGDTAAFLRTG